MKTTSYFTISSIIDGTPQELKRTEQTAAASFHFNEHYDRLKKKEDEFLLTLSLVYETADERGQLVSLREQEIRRIEFTYTSTY